MKNIPILAMLLMSLILTACKENKEYVHIGPNWAALHAVQASEKTFKVSVKVVSSATLGETLKLKVKSEQAGRLWILQVDANDEVSPIYPNMAIADNQIAAGSWLSIPAEGSSWSLEASEPVGPSVIAFIVTSPGTDLSNVFNGQPEQMDKALRIVENASAWGLAKQVIDIKEK